MRKVVNRQLQEALARLAPDATPLRDNAGVGEMTALVVAALDRAGARTEGAELSARRLAGALDRIGQGVVICDQAADVVYRNAEAATLVRGRGSDVLAEQAVREAITAALAGATPEQTLELFAPYRRTLLIRAFPLPARPFAAATLDGEQPVVMGGAGEVAAEGVVAPHDALFPAGTGAGGGLYGVSAAIGSVDAAAGSVDAAFGSVDAVPGSVDAALGSVDGRSGIAPGRDASFGDEITGAVAVVEDVSQRRRLEDVRRDFVANVSHELKTPVGALSLLAETLEGEDDPEVVGRLLGRVAAEADRLGRIIDDLLDLSRIEANEAPTRELVPVHRVLGEAIEPLRMVARSHDIDLSVCGGAPGLSVPGDRRDLVSAVANLVDNAIKYSEPGSRVTVDVACRPPWIEISVADQGIGIPARDLERIFERFYRVDRARSRSTGGTGLGLSIVRHVAANHGGSVAVRSVEGEGSTFTLCLPVEGGTSARILEEVAGA